MVMMMTWTLMLQCPNQPRARRKQDLRHHDHQSQKSKIYPKVLDQALPNQLARVPKLANDQNQRPKKAKGSTSKR